MLHAQSPTLFSSLSDQALVERYQQTGDQQVLARLLERHRELIHRQVLRFGSDLLAEDLEQDLYLLLYEKLPQAGEMRCFRAWLSTIVRNRLRDRLRKRGSREQYQDFCQQLPQAYELDVEQRLDRSRLLDEAWAQVNEKEKACLSRRYLDEMSYQEIADDLGLSLKQVCGRLDRGMKKMREQLR